MRQPFTSMIRVLALGAMLTVSTYAGDSVQLADLPSGVKSALEHAAHGSELTNITKSTNAEGKTVYSATFTKNNKPTEVTVDESGKLVKKAGKEKEKDKDKKKKEK